MPHFPLSRQSALMLAVSQALLFSCVQVQAADADAVIAQSANITISDRHIETTGDGVAAMNADSGGKIEASGVSATTSGKLAHGVLVYGFGSQFNGTDELTVTTSGEGAAGLKVHIDGKASVEKVKIATSGQTAHGVDADSLVTINLGGGSITTTGDKSYGIRGWNGIVNGNDLAIRTEGAGAIGILAVSGSAIDLRASSINTYGAGAAGIQAGGKGQIELKDSHVKAHGAGAVGALLSGGSLAITGGSIQSHDAAALSISGSGNTVDIDGAYIGSTNGPAIKVDAGAEAIIAVSNGSTLSAGDGKGELLDVQSDSVLDLVIDGSFLHGSLTVPEGGLVNVRLQNGTSFTGQMTDIEKLQLDSDVNWNITGDSSAGSLVLNGGTVDFAGSEYFHRLAMGELSGNGSFGLKLDINNRQIDFLDVNGQASGSHIVRVQNTGAEPAPGFDPLQVIHTEGGNANFALLGGRVDLGAFSYAMEREGDDWFLTSSNREVSPATRSVQALFNSAPTVWYGEMSTLRSRMGEVRSSGQGGSWMRSYGNKYQVSGSDGLGYRQNQTGLSLGVDAPLVSADGVLLVGLLAGYSKSDLSQSRGSSGTVDSFYVGTYGTWMRDDGYYVDGVLKLNQFQNRAHVVMSDFSKAKGNYRNYGVGASLELGRTIQLTEHLFVEPFAQASVVAVQGKSFSLDSELQAENAMTRSLLGKVGMTLEHRNEWASPYIKVALAQEFARDNEIKVNGNRFKNDLHGTRGELGVGLALSVASNLQLHADFEYMNGQSIEQPWGANVGLRYAFD